MSAGSTGVLFGIYKYIELLRSEESAPHLNEQLSDSVKKQQIEVAATALMEAVRANIDIMNRPDKK